MTAALAGLLRPCGPVLAGAAGPRAMEAVAKAAERDGWSDLLARAEAALSPVFAASPYLASLAVRAPNRLRATLEASPQTRLGEILTAGATVDRLDLDDAKRRLRELKAETHLLTALADLGGVWDLDQVTGALTRFADVALDAAVTRAARIEVERGRLTGLGAGERGPIPGYFCIAMGKFGAFELNYSSDIDICVFFDPDVLPLAEGVEPEAFASRMTKLVAELLQERTSDGYVFRVDLRLRPDPSSTPPAVSLPAALDYYESVGQNWERAAFIKARAVGGDTIAGEALLRELRPFIWRRNLDFAAIADIHSIKRQIHVHKAYDRLAAKGADLKLGHGGIREIEFYVQTQQLILGGRDPGLRARRTVDSLAALARAGHIAEATATELTQSYAVLRALEHRAQMIGDEQTHKLPEQDAERRRIAALWGEGDLRRFDAAVERVLKGVNRRYGELFAEDEDLSSRHGSLVFTGVEDDPETIHTLTRMGFSHAERVAATIRAWHHGRIAATRTERGRELFTRLVPRLLEAAHATGAPDMAFLRFADFFASLSSGVQVQSLFLAQPKLFELVVQMMAFAPQLAATLARRPAALDAMLDSDFFAPIEAGEIEAAVDESLAFAPPGDRALAFAPPGFEAAMDAVRRVRREQAFRIGVQVISGLASAAEAGPAFADLADACIRALSPAAMSEVERLAGPFAGEAAVVALGKCGSREMTAGSDLDLMTLYQPVDGASASALKGWSAETFYARFTQRLIAALSAQTGEGGLYEVDMRLRPSGTSGPVAVSLAAFEHYYAGEAETWEFLAMTRARVVWASSEAFAAAVSADITAALRRPRDPAATARDVRDMRALMHQERPATGVWDMKLSPGGLVDVEFAAQHLQLIHAGAGGPLRAHTAEALAAMGQAGLADPAAVAALTAAWRLQQDLSQVLKLAFDHDIDPADEPMGFRDRLARAGGVRRFQDLAPRLAKVRAAAVRAFDAIVATDSPRRAR